ncbi:Cu+-exporting ATPase [Myroides guanonis]|uniref:Cu+-exporting ATPase n=2 Tax=Myroides guanonis TaxID=1150112 RepID=A0A1I3Q6S7_9FLAO|nr:Cu+-exporting ATPase [Myroides guanonis]
MKYVAVLALVGLAFTACKNEAKVQEGTVQVEETTSNAKEVVAQGAIEKASFEIEGMTCALGCAKLIEGKLAGLSGVKNVVVDFETKKATLEFDDAQQTEETITATVEKIANGIYTVVNMSTEEVNEAI